MQASGAALLRSFQSSSGPVGSNLLFELVQLKQFLWAGLPSPSLAAQLRQPRRTLLCLVGAFALLVGALAFGLGAFVAEREQGTGGRVPGTQPDAVEPTEVPLPDAQFDAQRWDQEASLGVGCQPLITCI